MDGHDDTPGSPGVATLHRIESHIISTRAAAHVVSRLIEELLGSPHPKEAVRRFGAIPLLVDTVTTAGLTVATMDLLRHVHAAHDAVRSAVAAGGAR